MKVCEGTLIGYSGSLYKCELNDGRIIVCLPCLKTLPDFPKIEKDNGVIIIEDPNCFNSAYYYIIGYKSRRNTDIFNNLFIRLIRKRKLYKISGIEDNLSDFGFLSKEIYPLICSASSYCKVKNCGSKINWCL